MSFVGALTEIKYAKYERKVFCQNAARNVIKNAKKHFTRSRRRNAQIEIEEYMEELSDTLQEFLYSCS